MRRGEAGVLPAAALRAPSHLQHRIDMNGRLGLCIPVLIAILSACSAGRQAPGGKIISRAGTIDHVAWTAEEKAKPIAVRPLRATAEHSVSLIAWPAPRNRTRMPNTI